MDKEAELLHFLGKTYGFTPWEVSQLTMHEIKLYVRGAELENEKQERASKRGSAPSEDQRRREKAALERFK